MTKKNKIILIICIALFVLIVGVFFLIKIYKIETNFISTKDYYLDSEVNLDNNLSFFATTLIYNKGKLIKTLEKNNPNLKVIDIESKFPFSLKVHVVEREPLFYFINNEKYVILDGDLKIIDIKESLDYSVKPILIKNEINQLEISKGDFLSLEETSFDNLIKQIDDIIVENLKTNLDFKVMFNQIEIKKVLSPITLNYVNEVFLKANSGVEIQLYDADNNLSNKFKRANIMYVSLTPKEKSEGVILTFENTNNKIETRYFV